jgi:hypothetical protein
MKKIKLYEEFVGESKKPKFEVGDMVKFNREKVRIEKVYMARNGELMYTIGSSKHGNLDVEAEDLRENTNFIREDVGSYKPGNISIPGTYDLNWETTDLDLGAGIYAKKYDFTFKMTMEDSSLAGEEIKHSVTMAFSDDSTGVFKLGEDIEKFSGLTLKDAEAYKETPDDAYIYGLVNIMNGGKDVFFWNNGTRLRGAAAATSPMSAAIEQVSHEAGVHLTRHILVKMVAQKLGVDITNEDWIAHDYGYGEYCWPAMGDPTDKTPEIIAIDEETFATSSSAILSMLVDDFFTLASNYLDLPKLK